MKQFRTLTYAVLASLCFSYWSIAEQALSETDAALIKWVEQRQQLILDELKTHVEINTGTENIAGLDQYRKILNDDLKSLGFSTQERSSAPIAVLNCAGDNVYIADHLVATLHRGGQRKLFLNGHMDTVFSADDEFQTLIQHADGTLAGPGVADMKGGIVIMLNALRALDSQGLLENVHITVLFNSDEEIGSLGSRPIIEELAPRHDIGMVFEGSYLNLMTRERKGLGQARLKVIGRESHAGGAHENGVSASLELAHKVIEIEKLTDYDKKTSVNVGVMGGGEKRNTIPGCAEAFIDMRFPDEQEGETLMAGIHAVAKQTYTQSKKYPEFPKSESWAILHRPAKESHPVVDELIKQAKHYSELIGEPIKGTRYSGGGTDGSIAQSVGLPTIDSLGIDGVGAHSSREAASVKSLMARTKLAAVLLAKQLEIE